MNNPIVSFAAAIALTATVTFAECDFPYYPEFADRICQYDEVTPLMAKKVAMTWPFAQQPAGVVCEPLLIRDVVGMPAYYMVGAYRGADKRVARRWNGLVGDLNAGNLLNAKDLYERLSFFEDDAVKRDFAWVSIGTYTFLSEVIMASGGIPAALVGYAKAYECAVEMYGHDDFEFARIIAEGHAHIQVFEFVDSTDMTKIVHVNKFGYAGPASLEKITYNARERVRNWDVLFDAQPDLIEKNLRRWEESDLRVSDEAAEFDLPEVVDLSGTE